MKYVQEEAERSLEKRFQTDGKALGHYKRWTNLTKKRIQSEGEIENKTNSLSKFTVRDSKGKTELKKKEQIMKERKVKQKKLAHLARRRHEKSGKGSQGGSRGGKGSQAGGKGGNKGKSYKKGR